MLPPAKHQHDPLALEHVELAAEEGRERRRASTFDDAFLEFDQAQDRERDRSFVHRHDAIDDALDDGERRIAQPADREAVGQRVRKRDGRRRVRVECSGEARRTLRLDPDDRDLLRPGLDRRADSRDEAAAADRNHDGFDVGRLFEDFESHRALARDHVDVVEWVDERETVARGDVAGVHARLGQIRSVQHDAGAELPAVGDLDQCREYGHYDGGRNAEETRVIGDTLRVVSGRRGDHAALALFG